MTKDLYTIGETARLLGVSTQTLRFYDKKDILCPVYTDPETGYRYYSYKQFHVIDRIKYLQGFGLALEDIYSIIKGGTVDGMMPFLHRQIKSLEEEINEDEKKIKYIQWYINYFKYLKNEEEEAYIYRIYQPKRYILEVPCYITDELSDMEIRLAAVKGQKPYSDLSYRRQYGYTVDFKRLLDGKFTPYTYFIYLREKPNFESEYFGVIPEGEYTCFRTKLLKENWKTDILKTYFNDNCQPSLITALEFEDNLVDWSDALYEVQILI